MANTNPIDIIYNKLVANMEADPQLERRIQIELEKMMRKVYSDAISQNTGYCMSFKVQETDVLALANKMGFEVAEIRDAFSTQWEIPKTAYMYNNPYYHILLLCIVYGVRKHNESIKKAAMAALLFKIWNGRKIHFVKYCNPDVMRYVIANLSGKYLARKYDSPVTLIIQYFVPTLLSKYGPWVDVEVHGTKRILEQAWGRVEQLFVSNYAPDLLTGTNKARSGLSVAYYNAKEKGMKISKPSSSGGSDIDDSTSSLDYYSSNEFDDLISGAVNYIIMNINPHYDDAFVRFVNRVSTVNMKGVELILQSIHDVRYADYIRDILELMFKQLQIANRAEICSKTFLTDVVKRKFISSKHSPIIIQLKKIIDNLLEKIFDDVIKYTKYSGYSNPRQGHIRKVIFYAFSYNLQRYMCSGSGGVNYGAAL